MKDHNSTINQEIKRRFVDREIVHCLSSVMDEVFAAGQNGVEGMPTYDDIENMWTYPEYYGKYAEFSGGSEDERDEEVQRLTDLAEELETEIQDEDKPPTPERVEEIEGIVEKINDEIAELKELDQEPQEIFEWWLVTGWLYEKLETQGKPVLYWGSLPIWGRTCTGQAILLDSTISRICEGMEILDGQKHSWADKK